MSPVPDLLAEHGGAVVSLPAAFKGGLDIDAVDGAAQLHPWPRTGSNESTVTRYRGSFVWTGTSKYTCEPGVT